MLSGMRTLLLFVAAFGISSQLAHCATPEETAAATLAECKAKRIACTVTTQKVESIGWWIKDGVPQLPVVSTTTQTYTPPAPPVPAPAYIARPKVIVVVKR